MHFLTRAFASAQVQTVPLTLSKYVSEADAGKQADYIDEWRRLAIWGLILKTFVFQFLAYVFPAFTCCFTFS